jgi:hypothetical protein
MFGSLYISKSDEDVKFGISETEHKYENNIIYLYLSPLIGIYKLIANYISFKNVKVKKLKFIFNKQTR